MKCYTIGYSDRKLEEFLELLRLYNIDCIMDIRNNPYSSNNSRVYDKEILEKQIKQCGINYMYMGNQLSVQKIHDELKKKGKSINFYNALEDNIFNKGINKIVTGIKRGHKIALMCEEKNPFNCSRGIVIGYALKKIGVNLQHIISDIIWKTQERIEEEIYVTYEPFFQDKFVNPTIQDMVEEDDYDKVNFNDIKKRVIEAGYVKKFKEIRN
ncbi:hypothetical protein Z968_00435 [Clostridium novyi A str. 4552]|uniref:DUF488 domain-containing protein n=1 Tax=Clostridium novyi A str. 4552 TaxID=1444289 RepID=A0A0A0IC10_CLONO|nr:DUF488 domain-containing protein [Clostridium novyi]KGM98452.1 hypothetical protein Z968_00435 [Clostridium novyi A str. 4552]